MSHPRGDDYQARFDQLAASGTDVHGEATFVRRFSPRRVLDAGCGTGRVAIELARHGIEVVGVDVDAAMLATARRLAPALPWIEADLATADLGRDEFDVAVLAGNVLIFVAPGTERDVLRNVASAVRPGGHVVAGFSLRPGGYGVDALDADASTVGLRLVERWATWDREPFAGGDYGVSAFAVS